MAGYLKALGVAWFRREDYQRIREISDDEMIPTFDQWEAKLTRFMASEQPPPGVVFEKVMIDPDELLAFAQKSHGGKIDSKVRGEFAAWVIAQKYDTNH